MPKSAGSLKRSGDVQIVGPALGWASPTMPPIYILMQTTNSPCCCDAIIRFAVGWNKTAVLSCVGGNNIFGLVSFVSRLFPGALHVHCMVETVTSLNLNFSYLGFTHGYNCNVMSIC